MASKVTLDTRVLDKIIATTPQKIERFLDSEAQTMVNNIKLSFGTSPPGRTYKRGATFHVASIPRFPPNVDTGELRSLIKWTKPFRFARWIMSEASHSEDLELGTTKMAPRPFMVPEALKAFTRLPEDMRRAGLFR